MTAVAYAGVAVAVGWWFWRTQGDGVRPVPHAVGTVVFALLWPLALPYRAAVRGALHLVARYRLRRRTTEDRPRLRN